MRGDEEEDPWFLCLVDEAGRDWAGSLANGGVWPCHVLWLEFDILG